MPTKRFLVSWVFSSIAMYLLSYAWHGLFLNDYKELNYPKEIFLIFAVLVYLVIGFIIAKATDVSFLINHLKNKPLLRGIIAGAACGFFLFIMATVIGVSFNKNMQLATILFDVTWQVLEQTFGGIVVGVVHILVFDPTAILEE